MFMYECDVRLPIFFLNAAPTALKFLWDAIAEVQLRSAYIKPGFYPPSSFSTLQLKINHSTPHDLKFRDVFKRFNPSTPPTNLPDFSYVCVPTHFDPTLVNASTNEREVFYLIVQNFLSKLVNESTLEAGYKHVHEREVLKRGTTSMPIKCGHLGMGTMDVWHGEPDCRLRVEPCSTNVVKARKSQVKCSEVSTSADSDLDSSPSTDGQSTNAEAKLHMHTSNLSQLISTTVTAAFTERNRHRDTKFTPCILIDRSQFVFSVYSPEQDYLFVSEKVRYIDDSNVPIASAVLLIWIILHHRL